MRLSSFFIIIGFLVSFKYQQIAFADQLTEIQKLSDSRMQELLNFSIQHREKGIGLCENFSKAYAYKLEEGETVDNGLGILLIRDAVTAFSPQNVDLVTVSHVDFNDDNFYDQLANMANKIIAVEAQEDWQDLVKPIIKYEKDDVEIFAGSAVFQKEIDGQYKSDLMDHFALLNKKTNELFYFGAGQCEF